MKDIRIASVIFNSVAGHSRWNLDRMTPWVKAAKTKGAGIVCFPEMNMTGYSISKDIGKAAETAPGPMTRHLSRLARDENIVILAGMAEIDASNRIFASHFVFQTDGSWGVYRKLHIAPPERTVFSAGSQIPLFDALGVKFGIQLCYDAHFPELSTHMAVNGAEIIFMPHASPRGAPEEKYRSWMRHLPARAFDNGLFVIACNQVGDNGAGLRFPGIALVIGPSGEILDQQLSRVEGMVVSDLMAADLARVRNHRMRYFLPHRRPELFRNTRV